MKARAIHQRLLRVAAMAVTVQTPLAVDHPDLEQHPVLAARLLQMEPALFRLAAVGAEDRFPGEGLGAGQRMHVDQERSVYAVELDRLAGRRVDHPRIAQNRRRVAADAIEAIEGPGLLIDRARERQAR